MSTKLAIANAFSSQSQEISNCMSEHNVDQNVINLINDIMSNGLNNIRSLLKLPSLLKTSKRVKSAFFYFCDENRGAVKNAFPDLSNSELMKKVGEKWRSLSSEEKSPYEKLTEKEKIQKNTQSPKKEKNYSSYQIFCNGIRNSIKNENPGATFSDLSKLLAKAWKDHNKNVSNEAVSSTEAVEKKRERKKNVKKSSSEAVEEAVVSSTEAVIEVSSEAAVSSTEAVEKKRERKKNVKKSSEEVVEKKKRVKKSAEVETEVV